LKKLWSWSRKLSIKNWIGCCVLPFRVWYSCRIYNKKVGINSMPSVKIKFLIELFCSKLFNVKQQTSCTNSWFWRRIKTIRGTVESKSCDIKILERLELELPFFHASRYPLHVVKKLLPRDFQLLTASAIYFKNNVALQLATDILGKVRESCYLLRSPK
jgi:hypothetical protein